MELRTLRTRLRRLQSHDLLSLQRLESDANVTRFTGLKVPQTLEQTQERLKRQIQEQTKHEPLGIWAAELLHSKQFVGWFMLIRSRFPDPELGFMIDPQFWNQGLTTEISVELIRYGFEDLQLERIVATTHPENTPSIRVLEKLGFLHHETRDGIQLHEIFSPRAIDSTTDSTADYTTDELGRVVFTRSYHLKRGYCCHNGCVNCPY